MAQKKVKKAYMSDETFAELIESMGQALEYERGARSGYRVKRIRLPRPQRPVSSAENARMPERASEDRAGVGEGFARPERR
jgi:hypothetical protein